MYKEYTYDLDHGEPVTVRLPAHYAICDRCQGRGTTSRHLGSFTQSEWAEQDEDFKEDYLSGAYDKPCGCDNGKVLIVDRERCSTPEQLAALSHMDDMAQFEAECRAERRAEARMMGELDDFGD